MKRIARFFLPVVLFAGGATAQEAGRAVPVHDEAFDFGSQLGYRCKWYFFAGEKRRELLSRQIRALKSRIENDYPSATQGREDAFRGFREATGWSKERWEEILRSPGMSLNLVRPEPENPAVEPAVGPQDP